MLSLPLRVDALRLVQAILLVNRLDYDELIKRLELCSGQRHVEPVFGSQLESGCQKPNEGLPEFEAKTARLVRIVHPTAPDDVC